MEDFELKELYDEAYRLYNESSYKEAIAKFEEVISIDPEAYPESFYWLGDSYYRLDDLQKAQVCYQKGLEYTPKDKDLLNGIGICYYDVENYDEAEIYYRKAIKSDPKFHYGYYNISLLERKRGNKDKEKELLEKCLEIKPNYTDGLNALGNIYYGKSEYDLAKELYIKAIRANSTYKYPYYNLGLIEEINMDYSKAAHYFQKAIECDPNYELAKKSLEEMKEKIQEEEDIIGANASLNKEGDEFEIDTSEDEESIEKKSYLNRVGRNLNELAKAGKLTDLIGREFEIQTILEVLYKRFKNSPVLLGNPGVGKTVIVEGLAQRIVDGKVPDVFKDKVIIELNIGSLIAGTKYRGELETKLMRIINEAKENENYIIFIDEVHTIYKAGAVEGGDLDVAQMLKPVLARGEVSVIGATTLEEYRKYIEQDAALSRRFFPIKIKEPSEEDTKQILNRMRKKANNYYNVQLTEDNINLMVELAGKFIKNRFFPDKAIDIMEKVASRYSLRGQEKIGTKDIKDVVSEITGIKFSEEDEGDLDVLQKLEVLLKEKVFGQDPAIEALANILRITKRRLDLRPERPDGVFLFTGPTGVGKTYLAKCLAETLYGDKNKMLRLDMSEFSESVSISRLLGAAPGYIGYDDTPALTRMVVENPSSILLLDELEKAHPEVVKIFLQIFDEGFITDSRGKKIYFSDVTIIMTSNAMVRARKSLGFGDMSDSSEAMKTDDIVDQLTASFPKEFLNRIDEIVLFNALTREDVERILTSDVFGKTKERFKQENIEVDFDASVVDKVIEEGYSHELGARNLHRAFDKLILSPLVRHVYDNKIKDGKLKVFYKNEEIVVK